MATEKKDESTETKTIATSVIRMDLGTQFREATDKDIVKEYAEKIKAGIDLGDPDVFYTPEGDFILGDGFKRIHARIILNHEAIKVKLHEGTLLDAQLFAAGANAEHGERRGYGDIKRAVLWLDEQNLPQFKSNVAAAKQVRCSEGAVRAIRKERDDAIKKEADRLAEEEATRNAVTDAEGKHPSTVLIEQWAPELLPKIEDGSFTVARALRYAEAAKAKHEGQQTVEQAIQQEKEQRADEATDPEDELTDEEFLASIPLFRYLQTLGHGGMFFRNDALAWRTLKQAGVGAKLAKDTAKALQLKEGATTPLYEAVCIPHPNQWKACSHCQGAGCNDCLHSGYDLRFGIEVNDGQEA